MTWYPGRWQSMATEDAGRIQVIAQRWGPDAADRVKALARATPYALQTCCALVEEAERLRSQGSLSDREALRLLLLTRLGA